jgi:hypothetical protein
VELMVAMTITLLLMAGLAKSFGVIGDTIKAGRSQVTMSGQLRTLGHGMRSKLGSRTVAARPPISSNAGQGYFMYYEGPLTEHTFGLFGARPQRVLQDGTVVFPGDAGFLSADAGPTYRRHGRIGDIDDYVAFTAKAPGDQWFTGKVPAYLVDPNATDPMEPRLIRSKYAEIILWASPEWSVDPTSHSVALAANPSAMPSYRDQNLDLVPDRIVLHQRTLLIRPDLNVQKTIDDSMAAANPPFTTSVLRPFGYSPTDPLAANAARVPPALERVYPIGFQNPDSSAMTPPAALYPSYVHPSSNNDNQFLFNSNWLVGMAPLHHFFDLSLRRVMHPDTGEPTGYVAANSLEDLVQPHNRFAHVRYPGRFFGAGTGGSDNATSMPLLALGWNDAILNWNWQGSDDPRDEVANGAQPAWFPTSHPSPRTLNSWGTAGRSGLFNGWLLPQFELGNPNPIASNSTAAQAFDKPLPDDQWRRGYLIDADLRWDRTGEDVVAANILAFDIRGYDPTAPVFITSGADAQPGRAQVDDDGVGGSDVTFAVGGEAATELGAFGSDDELVNVTDLGIWSLMGQPIMDPQYPGTFGNHLQAIANRGAFVDLFYPYLAGTPLLSRTAQADSSATPRMSPSIPMLPIVTTNYNAFMGSDLSQFPIPTDTLNSIKRSGKLLHTLANDGTIVFFQPTYDTWTDGYESDGFDQSPSVSGAISPAVANGTVWILNQAGVVPKTPRIPAASSPLQIDTGQFDSSQPETSPPLAVDLSAISVTVRLIDTATEEMTQFTLVEDLQ